MFKALATLAFFGMLRCSEYISPGKSTWWKEVTLGFADIVIASNQQKAQVQIKASKADPFREGCVLRLMALDSIFCPVKALGRYLDIHVSRGGPLFQFEHGTFFT